AGMALHEITGQAVWDAIGSILVGILLGFIAVFLIKRNGEFLLGQSAMPATRTEILTALLRRAEIDRVTYLHV
ncbi:cation transporter, partial [Streptomyces sp. SID10244]|nr:cation transporter [Streptomyces sp. SID10244]